MSHFRFALVAGCLLALLTGCSVAPPTASPTPSSPPTTAPTAVPTDEPSAAPTAAPTEAPTAAPTETPLPSPSTAEIAAWAADICDLNADFLADSQQITLDLPEPSDRTLAGLQEVHAQRQPRIIQLFEDALERLGAITPYPGGEVFRFALVNELQGSLNSMPDLFEAIADATSVEEVDTALTARGPVATALLLGSARAVSEIDIAFADAIAAITTGCRFFELDARARPHGLELPDFTELAFEDTFDDDSNFSTGPFSGGTREIANDALTVTFSDNTSFINVAQPTQYHDVRLETLLGVNGFALGGLACRDDGDTRYSVVVNPIGLVLIYGGGQLIGRRAAPEGFDSTNGINLAIECVAGNLDQFTIAVYLDGELVAEIQQEDATAREGFAGMFAQSLGAGSSVTFEEFRVLVVPD